MSFGSDIKSLHRLLDLEKNKAGTKKEEEEEEKKVMMKKRPALIIFTDCMSVIFPSSLIGG